MQLPEPASSDVMPTISLTNIRSDLHPPLPPFSLANFFFNVPFTFSVFNVCRRAESSATWPGARRAPRAQVSLVVLGDSLRNDRSTADATERMFRCALAGNSRACCRMLLKLCTPRCGWAASTKNKQRRCASLPRRSPTKLRRRRVRWRGPSRRAVAMLLLPFRWRWWHLIESVEADAANQGDWSWCVGRRLIELPALLDVVDEAYAAGVKICRPEQEKGLSAIRTTG